VLKRFRRMIVVFSLPLLAGGCATGDLRGQTYAVNEEFEFAAVHTVNLNMDMRIAEAQIIAGTWCRSGRAATPTPIATKHRPHEHVRSQGNHFRAWYASFCVPGVKR